MNATAVSWGLVEQVVKETWRMLSKAKHIPQLIVCSRPKDFIAAGWLSAKSTSTKIGSVACVSNLLQPHCKMVLLSIDNDEHIADLVMQIHKTCAALPFLYQLKTVVLFDRGYPSYDFTGFTLPYQPTFPWETKLDGERSFDTLISQNSHLLSPSLTEE